MSFLNRLVFLLCFVVLIVLSACTQEDTQPQGLKKTGVVTASKAYFDYFGSPPQGKDGRAFARVGYLPLKEDPERVRPFPLFLFSETNQVQKILDRLVSGELHLPADFDLYNPFPEHIEVMTTPLGNPTVTISLMTQADWSAANQKAGALSLAETVLQFPEVKTVKVMLNGQPHPHMPEGGFSHQPEFVAEITPPTLVLVAGMWEKDSDNLDELLVEFDRPIKVNTLKLLDTSGRDVNGEYFTSIFQMAVVIHPEHPKSFRPGMELSVEWDIVDGLGRSGHGTKSLPIQRFDH